MKKTIYALTAMLLLCVSCFDDKGNYDYSPINPPHWLHDTKQPVNIVGRQGGNITLDASSYFVWDNNAEQRSQEVNYEWEVNGKIVAEGLKVTMPVETLMEKAGIKEFSGGRGTFGTFSVVEKSTGVKYMVKILLWTYPKYTVDTWLLLTEEGGKSKMAAIWTETKTENGQNTTEYKLLTNAYEEANEGKPLEGKPIRMAWAADKHVGSQGSLTVITDKAAYEINAEDLSLYDKIGNDHFLGGMPAGLKVVARADIDGTGTQNPGTFLLGDNGKLYTRMMSINYLGGKFLTEPYLMDDKDYFISRFGNARYSGMTPCYDSKNRRVCMAAVQQIQQQDENGNYFLASAIKVLPLTGTPAYGAPVTNFPEGTEVLYIGATGHVQSKMGSLFTCIYNDPASPDKTTVADFEVSPRNYRYNANAFYCGKFQINKVQPDARFVTSINIRNRRYTVPSNNIFYTEDNKVRYLTRSPNALYGPTYANSVTKGELNIEISSKITFLTEAYWNNDALFIGCENGDVYIVDIKVLQAPKLLYKGNVGGKVISAQQLGSRTGYHDKYNN